MKQLNRIIVIILKIKAWIVWIALFLALIPYRVVLPNEIRGESKIDMFLVTMLVVPTIVSVAIRWFVIPRFKNTYLLFIFMIVGISLGESLTFYGIFLFGGYLDLFFILSVVLVAQYVPIYMHKRESNKRVELMEESPPKDERAL